MKRFTSFQWSSEKFRQKLLFVNFKNVWVHNGFWSVVTTKIKRKRNILPRLPALFVVSFLRPNLGLDIPPKVSLKIWYVFFQIFFSESARRGNFLLSFFEHHNWIHPIPKYKKNGAERFLADAEKNLKKSKAAKLPQKKTKGAAERRHDRCHIRPWIYWERRRSHQRRSPQKIRTRLLYFEWKRRILGDSVNWGHLCPLWKIITILQLTMCHVRVVFHSDLYFWIEVFLFFLTERFKNGMLSKRKKQICHLKKTTREIGGAGKNDVCKIGGVRKKQRAKFGVPKKNNPSILQKNFPDCGSYYSKLPPPSKVNSPYFTWGRFYGVTVI